MKTTTNDARLDFRLRSEAKARIEEAAILSGMSVSDFAVSTLLRAANQIVESHRTLRLSRRDFERFLAALDSDAEPNPALRQAAERYQKRRA